MSISDQQLYSLIEQETERQSNTLSLIASENYPSEEVLKPLGSILSAKYAEGYPGARYYAGNEIVDQIEELARSRAKALFGAEHANVQPYSGSPANAAVYLGLLEFGDKIMGMSLPHGGHLTHGHKVTFSGKAYQSVSYKVGADGLIDYEALEKLAQEEKPKLIISGASAYPRAIDFERIGAIAKSVGAMHMADISHIAGLVAAGLHQNPVPYADVVTTTTHKTLRGPRAAIILCRSELAKQIDRAVFPGLQGGPHLNAIAGVAVALHEAAQLDFKDYIQKVIDNARALSAALVQKGFTVLTGGTDNHLLVIDLQNKEVSGAEAETALELVGIVVNKNTIPNDPRKPMDPSGVRLGAAAVTTRGATTEDMKKIAQWITVAIDGRGDQAVLEAIKLDVRELAQKLPVPGL